jgi:CheY-like chemotaxis protein
MTEQILLAEDNQRDVEITLDAIAEGRPAAIVTVVHNGEEALDYLSRRGDYRLRAPGNPDVILLDIKMPKISGFELLARLRADPAFAQLAVVVLSSSAQEQDLFRAYEHQADGYLIKPPRPQQLANAIDVARGTRGGRTA